MTTHFRSNARYAPTEVLVPEDVKNPWQGLTTPWKTFMDLPLSQGEAVRLARDWTFCVRSGSNDPYWETIPAGSRVWLHRPGNVAVTHVIAAEVPEQ